MGLFRVVARGLDKLARVGGGVADAQARLLEEAKRDLATSYLQAVQRHIPIGRYRPGDHTVPGRLLKSLRLSQTRQGFVLEATAPYAVYVLAGVREHWMRYLLGRTVTFIAKDGAVVTRTVRFVGMGRDGQPHWLHPGIPPRDFFQDAWDDPIFQRALVRATVRGVRVSIAYLYPSKGPVGSAILL